jgi:hypothetical protein
VDLLGTGTLLPSCPHRKEGIKHKGRWLALNYFFQDLEIEKQLKYIKENLEWLLDMQTR